MRCLSVGERKRPSLPPSNFIESESREELTGATAFFLRHQSGSHLKVTMKRRRGALINAASNQKENILAHSSGTRLK